MNTGKENMLLEGLRRSGARITPQRIAICDWLERNYDTHPTIGEVYEALREQFPTMSLATVYNTISALARLDLVHEVVQTEDGSTRYDVNTAPHINMVCMRCGRIIDEDEADLSALMQAASAHGFLLQDINVVLHGICSDCQKE
ncbi:MAG: Fur family transcriptional regulator [Anaerolineae bacterium]